MLIQLVAFGQFINDRVLQNVSISPLGSMSANSVSDLDINFTD